MTYQELQNRVMAFGYGEADREWVKIWLNMAYADIATRRRWSWLERTTTVTATAGQQTVAIPTPNGALVTYWGRLKPTTETTPPVAYVDEMTRDPEAPPRNVFDATNPGPPRTYALWNNQVVFYPVPNGTYTYTLRYWTLPPELINNSDVPAIPDGFHNILVLGALMYGSERDQSQGLYSQRQAAYEAAITRLEARDIYQQAESPTKVPMPSHYGGVFDG